MDSRSKHRLCALLCALALAGAAAPSHAAAPRRDAEPKLVQKPQPRISPERLEKAIHALINRERAAKRLKPLAWDAKLGAIARRHSADMARRNYFSHDSPEGAGFDARYRKARYGCMVPVGDVIHGGAENIARDELYAKLTTIGAKKYYDWHSEDELARRTVSGWMKSPGHRANILTAHWRREGLGVVVTRDLKVYVTQDFC